LVFCGGELHENVFTTALSTLRRHLPAMDDRKSDILAFLIWGKEDAYISYGKNIKEIIQIPSP